MSEIDYDKLIEGDEDVDDNALDEVIDSTHFAAPVSEAKSVQAPWSDEELAALTDDLSEADVKAALATATPEMRAILSAGDDEE